MHGYVDIGRGRGCGGCAGAREHAMCVVDVHADVRMCASTFSVHVRGDVDIDVDVDVHMHVNVQCT